MVTPNLDMKMSGACPMLVLCQAAASSVRTASEECTASAKTQSAGCLGLTLGAIWPEREGNKLTSWSQAGLKCPFTCFSKLKAFPWNKIIRIWFRCCKHHLKSHLPLEHLSLQRSALELLRKLPPSCWAVESARPDEEVMSVVIPKA